MDTIQKLILDISVARRNYLDQVVQYNQDQAQWKPGSEVWNMVEITEHLFWAEQGGILGMWKSVHAIREGMMERTHESVHKDMSIEQIIERTWQPKEKVPATAAPRMGGPLTFWSASLNNLQTVLEAFGSYMRNGELRVLAHPHPISGPLDFHQRLEFLRFHIDRHRHQVRGLIIEMNG